MRKSNFELLRIICILMVITLHYLNGSMGGAFANVVKNSFNYYLVHFLESLCIVSVNVFILITGYFSYKKESIKLSKAIYLIFLSCFYGIIIFVILYLFGRISLTKNSLFNLLLNCTNQWFVVVYIVLYLLIPYINKLVNSIGKKEYQIIIFIGIIFFYLWPTIYTKVLMMDNGYGIINFINLYLIGSYIGKYDIAISKYKSFGIYLICGIITFSFSLLMEERAFGYNSIFNLIGAIMLFMTFKNMHIKDNKIINYLSTYTFSTYIIHVNSFIVVILFQELFRSNLYYNSKFLVVNLLISVIGVYLLCIIIEFTRRLLFEKIIDRRINKIILTIEV